MAKQPLRQGRIKALPATTKPAFLWDSEVRGFGVRVSGSVKSFIFQTRLDGRTFRKTIARVDDVTLEEAREIALSLRAMVRAGVHPDEEEQRKKAQQVAKKRQTAHVADAWSDYLSAKRKDMSEPGTATRRRGVWGERHYADHLALAQVGGQPRQRSSQLTDPGPLASLMSIPLRDLTAARLADWLRDETASRPTRAALAFRLFRAFWRWCASQPEYSELVSVDVVGDKSVKRFLPKPEPKSDCLQREQLPVWFAAVRKIGNPAIRAYLQCLLLTGARREELAHLTWDAVDFQWQSLTIKDKVAGSRMIPLTHYVANLINGLPRRPEVPWVFSNAAGQRLVEPRLAHKKALAVAGLPEDLTLHGLRRSFGTLAEWVEMPVGIVAQIMGHKPSAIAEKHYRRRPLDLLRLWHTRIETFILDQAGIEQPQPGTSHLSVVANSKKAIL